MELPKLIYFFFDCYFKDFTTLEWNGIQCTILSNTFPSVDAKTSVSHSLARIHTQTAART